MPPPVSHPLPLSSPPQGEQFCSATHCAIFGSLCYLLFKDADAVCQRIKESTHTDHLNAIVCAYVQVKQHVFIPSDMSDVGGRGIQIWVEYGGC